MNVIPIFSGEVKDGRIILDNQEYFDRWLRFHVNNKKVLVTVEAKRNIRSGRQNRYFHAYLQIISEELGGDMMDWKEYLKSKCLPPRHVKLGNKLVQMPAKSSKLSKGEMVEFIMNIEQLTGVPAPDPQNFDIKLSTDE